MEEFKLIKKASRGDIKAFEKLIIPYEKRVYNVALGICKNEQDAYDISQEVFIKVFQKLSTFTYNSTFSTWLYRIVKNTSLDYLRKEKRLRANEMDESNAMEIKDTSLSPLDELILKEEMEILRFYLDKLDETDRNILLFREVNGLSYEELAKIFDIKLGTVKSRIFRAKKRIRKLILQDKEQNS